jgi:hypothetical protein
LGFPQFASKRAVGSVAAAVFMVLTIVLIFGLMLVEANLIDAASQQMRSHVISATEKDLESIAFLDTKIIDGSLNITVFNDGGVSVHIVRLWITDNTTTPKSHARSDVSYWIDPGAAPTSIEDVGGTLYASHIYLFNIVSARGNIFQVIYRPSNTIVATVQGFGWITIDWNSYQYAYYASSTGIIGPLQGWCVSSVNGAQYQFTVMAVNHHPSKELRLLSWTYLKFISNTGASPKPFFIMRADSTAQTPQAYNPNPDVPTSYVRLPANPSDPQVGGTPTLLKFYANTPGGTNQGAPGIGDYSILVTFFYQYQDGSSWITTAQTVPYEASQVTDSTC